MRLVWKCANECVRLHSMERVGSEWGKNQTMGDSCSGSPSVKSRLLYFSRGWQHSDGISCSWRPHGCRLIADPGTWGRKLFLRHECLQASTLLHTSANCTSFSSKLWFFIFLQYFLVGKKQPTLVFIHIWSGQQPGRAQSPATVLWAKQWVGLVPLCVSVDGNCAKPGKKQTEILNVAGTVGQPCSSLHPLCHLLW